MLALAVAVMLAADPPVPPVSPPPLLPAEGQEIPPLPPQGPTVPLPAGPADPELEQERTRAPPSADGEFSWRRVAVTGGVAAGTGALLVGAAMAGVVTSHDTSGSTGILLLLSLPASLFLGTGLALLAHRGSGGLGGYGAHIGGGAIGGGLALLIVGLVATQIHGDPGVPAEVGGVMATAVMFGLGTALLGEWSHSRAMEEHRPRLGLAPTRGGAVGSLGFAF
jgi:hypothetical protein